jgi:hypothetical protein
LSFIFYLGQKQVIASIEFPVLVWRLGRGYLGLTSELFFVSEVRDLGLLVLFLRNFPEFGYLVIAGQDVHRIALVPQPSQIFYLLINIATF